MTITERAAALGFPTLLEAGAHVDPVAVRMLGRRDDAVAVALADGILEVVIAQVPTAAYLEALETASGCRVTVTITEPDLLAAIADRAHAEASAVTSAADLLCGIAPETDRVVLAVGHPALHGSGADLRPVPGPALSAADLAALSAFLSPTPHAADHDTPSSAAVEFTWAGRRWAATRTRASGHPCWTLLSREAPTATLADLGLPAAATDLASVPGGLLLLTSPAGGGRTHTAAALTRHIVATRPTTAVTVSGHDTLGAAPSVRGLVLHRRLGVDVVDVATAARDAVRDRVGVLTCDADAYTEDDVTALLRAAGAGLLVLVTVAGSDTPTAVSAFTMAVRAEQRPGILTHLAAVIAGGLHQTLLPASTGGQVAAAHVWWPTPAMRARLREATLATGWRNEVADVVEALVAAGRAAPTASAAAAGSPRVVSPAKVSVEVPAGWDPDDPDNAASALDVVGSGTEPRRTPVAGRDRTRRSSRSRS